MKVNYELQTKVKIMNHRYTWRQVKSVNYKWPMFEEN